MAGSHIALFAGVGMTDIAAEHAGYKTIAIAEIGEWNRKVLKKRYPDAQHYDDVRKVSNKPGTLLPASLIPRPLLISGGFPCQDVSPAGTGAGVANGTRSGLWSEFARIIREFQPEHVLIENSAMLKTRGLDIVLHDLMDLGYDARWDCLPAAAFGAPHLRDRIFIVAWQSTPEWRDPDEADDCFATWRHQGGVGDPASGEAITKLPRAGSMVNGYLFEDEPQAPMKLAKQAVLAASCPGTPTGLWPTPNQRDYKDSGVKQGNRKSPNLGTMAARYPTPRSAPNEWRTTKNAPTHGNGHGKTLAGEVNDLERAAGRLPAAPSDSAGNMNPEWVEWLMGLPLGWTDLSTETADLREHPGWDSEPTDVPRTIAAPADRKARLQALGNGLVWQCAAHALTMIPES